jgi:hypothetical protein
MNEQKGKVERMDSQLGRELAELREAMMSLQNEYEHEKQRS